MKKNKKIILFILITLILLIVVCFLVFKNTKEKIILTCNEKATISEGIVQEMNYNVIKRGKDIILDQNQKLTLSEKIYIELLKKGYYLSDLSKYFENSVELAMSENFEGYEQYVSYQYNNIDIGFSVDVQYIINKKSADYFSKKIGINLYESNINAIKNFFESSGMKCEKN
ncbi:MAG: hypothetical protein IKL65_05800 [Bacilli bacterium]|nr:hypothetical protein [Bacilli bacterium]